MFIGFLILGLFPMLSIGEIWYFALNNSIVVWPIVFTLGIVLLMLLISISLIVRFNCRIQRLVEISSDIASGNLETEFQASDKDEIGLVVEQLINICDKIKQRNLKLHELQLNTRENQWITEITEQAYIQDSFLENIPNSIYFKSLKNRFIRCNRSIADKYGFESPEDLVGLTDYDIFPEEIAKPKMDAETRIIKTGQPVISIEEKNDEGNWESTTKMALKDKNGKIIGTFGLSRNITKLKQTEAALSKVKEEAEQASIAKSEFLANVSHEFRSPMHHIINYSIFGIKKIDSPKEKLLQYFSNIRQSANCLLGLLNNLLDLSKLDSGKMEFCNVDSIIQDTITGLGASLEQHNLDVVLAEINVPTRVQCDHYKIGQVIRNIL